MSTAEATQTAARPAISRRRALRRSPAGRFLTKLPFWFLIAVIFVYALFPFYWAVRSAFTPEARLFDTPLQYFPAHPTLANFRGALSASFFQDALINSTIVAGSVTLLSLAIGSLAAYALGRFRFRGRSAVLYLMLSMTIFPQIAILGALYTMINTFHLYDKLGALILSYLIFTLPFTIWVLTSFMRALPGDLEEAAYVDITIERGVPIAVNGIAMPLLDLIGSLDIIAGAHRVGRMAALHAAHRALQHATVTSDVEAFSDLVVQQYLRILRDGSWFAAMRPALDAYVDTIQERVTGIVRLKLLKGDCAVVDCQVAGASPRMIAVTKS